MTIGQIALLLAIFFSAIAFSMAEYGAAVIFFFFPIWGLTFILVFIISIFVNYKPNDVSDVVETENTKIVS